MKGFRQGYASVLKKICYLSSFSLYPEYFLGLAEVEERILGTHLIINIQRRRSSSL